LQQKSLFGEIDDYNSVNDSKASMSMKKKTVLMKNMQKSETKEYPSIQANPKLLSKTKFNNGIFNQGSFR
jgi:hypothetical protein